MPPLPDPDVAPPDPTEGRLQIASLRDGDAVVIALSGEFDQASAGDVDAAIRDAEETDIGRIIVSLSDVSFIDSTALSTLLAAKKRGDGRLGFIPSENESVTRLLQVTGTTDMLS